MRNLEPHEGGSGSLLEIVDMMCSAVEAMAGVVRKQAILIEQAEIAGAIFDDDLSEARKQLETDLDKIEYKMRRL